MEVYPVDKYQDTAITEINYDGLLGEVTYTITRLDRNGSFFANGIMVGVEE